MLLLLTMTSLGLSVSLLCCAIQTLTASMLILSEMQVETASSKRKGRKQGRNKGKANTGLATQGRAAAKAAPVNVGSLLEAG